MFFIVALHFASLQYVVIHSKFLLSNCLKHSIQSRNECICSHLKPLLVKSGGGCVLTFRTIHADKGFRVADQCGTQMWSSVPVQFQVHVKVNHSDGENGCQAVQDFVHARRFIDLFVATVGLVFAVVHLILLLYIRYALRRRGFFLLFLQVRKTGSP